MNRLALCAAGLAVVLGTVAACDKPSSLDSVSQHGHAAVAQGDVEARLARLEHTLAGIDPDALQFLQTAYEQNDPSSKEADPNAVFAVNIEQDLANGQVEGAAGAPITIVEAWDFA